MTIKAEKLDRDIHRFINLTYNFNGNQVPRRIAVAKICRTGQLDKDIQPSIDMLFKVENEKTFLIKKGLDCEPIKRSINNPFAKEFGGFSVFDGHPDGYDQTRNGKRWFNERNFSEEITKHPSERNIKKMTYERKDFNCRQFGCYILRAGTELIDFNINWDTETTPGVCHGVLYPVKDIEIATSKIDPHEEKGVTVYYEAHIEQIQNLPWVRCDNIVILKAAAGYPANFPKPDPFVGLILSCLLKLDHESDKEPSQEIITCYNIVNKIIANQLTTEEKLIQTLELNERYFAGNSLSDYLSTLELSDEDIKDIQMKICKLNGKS